MGTHSKPVRQGQAREGATVRVEYKSFMKLLTPTDKGGLPVNNGQASRFDGTVKSKGSKANSYMIHPPHFDRALEIIRGGFDVVTKEAQGAGVPPSITAASVGSEAAASEATGRPLPS
jgi:hypothetical protein